MGFKKNKYHQQGVALVFAIVMAIVLFLMGFMIFALSGSLLKLSKNRKNYLENRVSVHQMFRDAVANNSFQYTQNIVPGVSSGSSNFTSGTYDFEITNNHIDDNANQRFDSFIVPENGYTMRTVDYYLDLATDQGYQRHITIRVPSSTQRSRGTSINKSAIELNIPAINFQTLSAEQLSSGSGTFLEADVGHIGSVTIDSSSNPYSIIFTDTNGNNSNALSLPNGFDSGSFALSQGWVLEDGSWRLSIGVYSTDGTQACVVEAPLASVLADISALECVSLEEDDDVVIDGARYPNPTGFPMCVEGDRYSRDHICQEDGILFIANRNNADGLPFKNSGDWRVYYPDSDWIAPYTQGARYSVGDLVVYDGILFRNTDDGESRDPFSTNDWEVQGISGFNDNINKYTKGSVVVFNGNFYKKKNNSNNKSPNQSQHWENLGSTLSQNEIDQLPADLQSYVSVGMEASDIQPYNIVFPYRDENPSQAQLNCTGEYPPIDTSRYSQCIDGNIYRDGDKCYENNMLFIAQYYTTDSPFNRPDAWRLDIPTEDDTDLDWVVPYSNNVMYADNDTRVIYDGRRFTNSWWVNDGQSPYENNSWIVDGIYEWQEDIQYRGDEVVIRDGNFYSANGWSKDRDPLTNSTYSWDEWINEGATYNNQTAEEVLNSCNALNNSNTAVQFNLGGNVFRDGTGNYITTNIPNLPNNFGLYGDNNPTTVNYTLSGSLSDVIGLIYVTDENGWVPLYNPAAQGETLVRDWGNDNATIFINTNYGNIPSGTYDLNIEMEYTLNGQTYQGSNLYSVTI